MAKHIHVYLGDEDWPLIDPIQQLKKKIQNLKKYRDESPPWKRKRIEEHIFTVEGQLRQLQSKT